MNPRAKSVVRTCLRGLSWLLFAIAGLSFLTGGRALNEFSKTERPVAEIEAAGLAVLCAGLGYLAKVAAGRSSNHLQDEDSEAQSGW
jgi:hypothetical protein